MKKQKELQDKKQVEIQSLKLAARKVENKLQERKHQSASMAPKAPGTAKPAKAPGTAKPAKAPGTAKPAKAKAPGTAKPAKAKAKAKAAKAPSKHGAARGSNASSAQDVPARERKDSKDEKRGEASKLHRQAVLQTKAMTPVPVDPLALSAREHEKFPSLEAKYEADLKAAIKLSKQTGTDDKLDMVVQSRKEWTKPMTGDDKKMVIIDVKGDGDCMYHAISWFLHRDVFKPENLKEMNNKKMKDGRYHFMGVAAIRDDMVNMLTDDLTIRRIRTRDAMIRQIATDDKLWQYWRVSDFNMQPEPDIDGQEDRMVWMAEHFKERANNRLRRLGAWGEELDLFIISHLYDVQIRTVSLRSHTDNQNLLSATPQNTSGEWKWKYVGKYGPRQSARHTWSLANTGGNHWQVLVPSDSSYKVRPGDEKWECKLRL